MCRSKSPIGPHWWMLDLGTTVDVEAIKIVIAVSCHYNGQLIVYKWHVTITSHIHRKFKDLFMNVYNDLRG